MDNTTIIAGLGNPGDKYKDTRHNIGFMVVDYLARRAGVVLETEKWSAYYAKARIEGRNVYLVKPDTFMNLSGQAVIRYLDYYKCSAENLIVVHDDIDMSAGRLKLTNGGGAGGHNGIKSIIQHLSNKDFFRLKFGVGRPGKDGVHPDFPVDKYVLSPFSQDEKEMIEERMTVIEDGLGYLLSGDSKKAKNLINSVK
mgnify:CR=1 FL=1